MPVPGTLGVKKCLDLELAKLSRQRIKRADFSSSYAQPWGVQVLGFEANTSIVSGCFIYSLGKPPFLVSEHGSRLLRSLA